MNLFDVIKFYKAINRLRSNKTPKLNIDKIKNIVIEYLDKRDKYINIFNREKKPLYVFDRTALIKKADSFQKSFRQELDDVEFYYAVKSNNYPEISRLLIKNNYGLDVSSGLELQAALELKAEKIVFSGPGKTDEELSLAVNSKANIIIQADSVNELRRLNAIAENAKAKVIVGLRIHTAKSGLWKKFGIHLDELKSAFNVIKTFKYIEFSGIQFHSSWNLTPDNQVGIIKQVGESLKYCSTELINSIKFIDIGGGFWPPEGEWIHYSATPIGKFKTVTDIIQDKRLNHYCCQSQPLSLFAKKISNAFKENIFPYTKCKILLEPGRWICNDSMQLLFSVIDKKSLDIVITDAGTNAIGWERFEHDYFPVINLSSPELKERLCNIYGSLCTPHDIWGYSYWGKSINSGDILLIPMQGAYTYSLRQSFIKPIPDVVII